jgi:hypothetical protein
VKQYCQPQHLVTTYDGTCPPGFVEVGVSPIVAGGLQAVIAHQKAQIATLEGHVKEARRMFNILRGDRGKDDQGLPMAYIVRWLQAVHATFHPSELEKQ